MYKKLLVAVIVPCFNEERKIDGVIQSMPDVVDRVYVVDDASQDGSVTIAEQAAINYGKDIVIIRQEKNAGVGAAICAGYKAAYADNFDLVAVMAGDGQMDPDDLESLLEPVALGYADYAKGNRFKSSVGDKIPAVRLLSPLTV